MTGSASARIAPCLWFDGRAEEAVAFYTGLFPDCAELARYRGPDGSTVFIEFTLAGQRIQALNGGPGFPHSNAMSLSVACDSQAEIDRLWEALTADGGTPVMCGWCNDRFGVPWQIVPAALAEWIRDGSPEAVERMMIAVRGMVKLNATAMEAAWRG